MAATPPSQYPFISPFHSAESGPSGLVALLQKIARHAVELPGMDDCAIALLDQAHTNLVVLATSPEDLPGTQCEPIYLPWHEGPLAGIAERREALILREARVDACLRMLAGEATRVLFCLPLLAQEQWLGVLTASTSTQDALAPEKLRLLTLLAEQATLAALNIYQAEQVRDADRMKANFLSLVTHELRSPLNTINGYLDLLLEGIAGDLQGQQREFIRRARAGSEHLYSLLEDLLLASRADAGQLRLNRAPASLQDLVTGAIDELEISALDGKVTLASELPADLPTLYVDSARLQQVLRNLLNNALHFTPAGGRVTISARILHQDGGCELVEIRVKDNGIGIAPEYHERVFERFFQVPRSEGGRTSGQGLGLAIVKMIVELHGGQVRVESTPGEGCMFIFTLDALAI